MKKAMVARVAVENAVFHFDKLYDYLLPDSMQPSAQPGCRVMVPFGSGNRHRQAVIFSLHETSDIDRLKPVKTLLDATPILNREMLQLAVWMKEHLFCTYFDAIKPMLPAGINLRIVASYRLSDRFDMEQIDRFSEEEKAVIMTLYNSQAVIEHKKLLDACGLSDDSRVLEDLCKAGVLIRIDDAVRRVGDATIQMVRRNPDYDGEEKATPKQKAVLELLDVSGTASVKEVCYFTGCTTAVVTNLCKKGVLLAYDAITYRSPVEAQGEGVRTELSLTESQQAAYESLLTIYRSEQGGGALLYGVTGSGKTAVFMRLVDEAFADGKGTIVMVPEISLTPQTLDLFHKRYGGKVAVFHSAMSLGQRMDQWRRVKNGDALVAIGTRSAVFAPFEKLGLVIIDEEQEHTYKSESSPRFHARDIARYRCAYHKAAMILSSATPSVETYCAAKEGRYTLCELPERYGHAQLPAVHTVDMKEEMRNGNTSSFSDYLLQRLTENLEQKKQSILLLNRRGHNTFVSCSSCGHVMTCPNCSITLTYHSANRRLMCHYCGYSESFSDRCPECGQQHIRYSGEGTQKVEQELNLLFPSARVLRMDADSTMARHSYEERLGAFARGEYDIMLGTQMVAKGLNFPAVTLVGVLNADASLYSEDFRAFERTFALLTQVVGRSGRGDVAGEAVIQTVTPENEIISLAAQQDYDSFYQGEIAARKMMVYPPYCSLCTVGFIGTKPDEVKQSAEWFLQALQAYHQNAPDIKMIVLGPVAALVPKVGGKYRYRLLIKTHNNKDFRLMMQALLRDFGRSKQGRTVSVFADINSESTF